MYDEIGSDLNAHFQEMPRKKTARWDLAVKALLHEKSDIEKRLSVNWLSERSKLSEPYLHNLLAGKIKEPPSDKLIKIADAFNISFPELATRAIGEYAGSFFKTGFGQRGHIDYGQHGFSIQSLCPPGTSTRDFFIGIMTIKPLAELKRWKFKDNSVICIYVEQGTLEIMYAGKPRRVHANESSYFDGAVPHRFKNIDTVEARLFIVTRPPLH